jgi:hypothetical protein
MSGIELKILISLQAGPEPCAMSRDHPGEHLVDHFAARSISIAGAAATMTRAATMFGYLKAIITMIIISKVTFLPRQASA